jgi:hypothetical protein
MKCYEIFNVNVRMEGIQITIEVHVKMFKLLSLFLGYCLVH